MAVYNPDMMLIFVAAAAAAVLASVSMIVCS